MPSADRNASPAPRLEPSGPAGGRLEGGRFVVPGLGGRGRSAHHLQVVLAPSPELRERARAVLRDRRIQTSVHYPPIHLFSRYRGAAERLRVAEEISGRLITLPLHPNMSEADVDVVCAALADA